MAYGSAEILREYLIRLGFQTDAISLKKFEDGLSKAGKNVMSVGTTVAGVALAVEAATAAFAYSMRKMYYESELANSSIKNLKSMAFAGKQVGISGEAMSSAIHGMAQAMRLNPGLQSFVESFGIKVTGRDMSDVAVDFLRALKEMPEFQGAKIAGMYGMDPDTFHLIINHLDELAAAKRKNLSIYKEFGVDPDEAAKQLKDYAGELDVLEAKVAVIGQKWLTSMAPAFKATTEFINGPVFTLLDKIAAGSFGGWIYDFTRGGPFAEKGSRVDERFNGPLKLQGKKQSASGKIGQPKSDATGLFEGLEYKYDLPRGLLDSVWDKESGRGQNMLSSAGAKGHFGFMDGTAKQYGVQDPNDLKQSATGAAKTFNHLLAKYGNDLPSALAAYNWGEGNVDSFLRTGKGSKGQPMPAETRDYVSSLGGGARLGGGDRSVTINQTTNIKVTGDDAKVVGDTVVAAQGRVNGDITRDARSLLQ